MEPIQTIDLTPSFREDLEFLIERHPITDTPTELAVARLRAQLQPKVEPDDLTMLRLTRSALLSIESLMRQSIDDTMRARAEIERKRLYVETLIRELLVKSKSS